MSGSAWAPGSRRTSPLTAMRPAARIASAPRRDASPAWARILLRRVGASVALRGRGQPRLRVPVSVLPALSRRLRDDQLALDPRQIAHVAQPEGHEEVSRGLVQVGPPPGPLAPGDPNHAPVQEIVEHGFRVDATARVDARTRGGEVSGADERPFHGQAAEP